jgi:formamidopyrimidine-DNA glycosylase
MPELPELHLFSRNLNRLLTGRRVSEVQVWRTRHRNFKNLEIKEFLVDQKIVRGIGNAYSDEILWACCVAPQSLCGHLPDAAVCSLHESVRDVLNDAIVQIERLAPEAIYGERRDFLKIHRPDRTHSPTGSPIRCATIGFRKAYFCDEQILY